MELQLQTARKTKQQEETETPTEVSPFITRTSKEKSLRGTKSLSRRQHQRDWKNLLKIRYEK